MGVDELGSGRWESVSGRVPWVGGCVRKVAIAGAARAQSYQGASERMCGTALRLFLLRSKKASSLLH